MIQPTYRECKTLEELWAQTIALNQQHFPEHSLIPIVGTKQVWSVFHSAGLLSDALAYQIKHGTAWDLEFTREVLHELQSRKLYLTNLVKWTGHDATLPSRKLIELFFMKTLCFQNIMSSQCSMDRSKRMNVESPQLHQR